MRSSFRSILLSISLLFWFVPILAQEANVSPPAPILAVEAKPSQVPAVSAIPDSLKPWETWVRDSDPSHGAPSAFNDAEKRMPLWPSSLDITAGQSDGSFTLSVKVFTPAWLPLPGSPESWPQEVTVDGLPVAVVEREGRPATRLESGEHRVAGTFTWSSMPQRLAIPAEIGMLTLTRNGSEVALPNWDANGFLWLKRNRAEEEAEQEFLDAKIYRLLEDGIPMWLNTEIELSVSGKSREEDLGYALPVGWKIASVDAKLPCAVDDAGRLRVQARAGKWTIGIRAFRTQSLEEMSYGESITPMVEEELIGFRARSDFRLIELRDIQAVDVSQTTFPEKWRDMPVFRWETSLPFRLEEKMRGMGFQKPAGLEVTREFWLDDDGGLMTFRDRIKGQSQQSWRLDASPGQVLGAARLQGEGQLITRNPDTGDSGIEIRDRNIDLEAVGRISDAREFPASGWKADVDQCEATLHLPPGWRVLALFGAEWVMGDWLTNWSLLDLFLLLVFTMSVCRIWGWLPALVAFLGFGLTYHEPGAPKFVWFVLLVPLAILRVGVEGKFRTLMNFAKYGAIALLLVFLVPFIGRQIQGVLYPQLEPGGMDYYQNRSYMGSSAPSLSSMARSKKQSLMKTANLQQDLQARIQTGPAVPSWKWREIRFGWRGPVTDTEKVKVLLISPGVQRVITVVRVIMLIMLAALLVDARRILPPFLRGRKEAMLVGLLLMVGLSAPATAEEFPPQSLLDELGRRILQTPDAFPRAAEIPEVKLTVNDSTLTTEIEIHVAASAAVPLPGRLDAWSPVSVTVDGNPERAVARHEGSLWIALEPGVHRVRVEGRLSGSTEWAWSFLLKPRRVSVEAPGWNVTGINPDGIPEDQVFFALKSPSANAEATYDRRDFNPAVAVEREIEIGLVWQVRSTLTRLNPSGKAVAFSIPLLPGERVLASNFAVENGTIDVRLGANQEKVSWESELPQTETLTIEAAPEDPWVERWKLQASPVWNVKFEGLNPVYEPGSSGMRPVWNPWPGEKTTLSFSRPEAVPGSTMTVRSVEHSTRVGSRQRVSGLKLDLQASLGQDLVLDLDPEADVTSLKIGSEKNPKGTRQPVRRDASLVIIPVRPGEQTIELEWKTLRQVSPRETVDRLELPVESSNIATTMTLPQDRWVLWAFGPLRGPAVRLWGLVVLSLVGAFVLGRLSSSPLRGGEWGLLALGLTQVHPLAMLLVICWFFLIAFRGSDRGVSLRPVPFNLIQICIILLALPVAGTILAALHRGLLGVPEMMVMGNQSSSTSLKWFAQRTDQLLPEAGVISVSIWYYRILMLAWALWLAISALRWIRWGWGQFSRRTFWKASPPKLVEK